MIPQPIDQVPLFLRLTDDERELISSHLRHLEFNNNDVIFNANKPAEFLGVVARGWVKLESETPQGRIALANLGAGSVIGEVDLLLSRPHSTSARAASATNLLALDRQNLQEIILDHPAIGLKFSSSLGSRVAYLDEYIVTQRLGATPLLSSLAEPEMQAIAGKLQYRSFQRGDTIFEAGAAGEAVYLIEEGSARLITPSREGESFDELDEGELFGQTALITGKPYVSTARAVTDLSVWVLTRSDYQALIHDHPPIKVAFSRALAETLGVDDQAKAVEQLRLLPLFADADDDALHNIAGCLVLRHFPAGELIYAEATPGDVMYFIESGEVRLVSDDATEKVLLDRKKPGDSFGEMALLTGRTRGEAAKAFTDTTVWALYKTDYDDLIVRHPALSLALSRALSGRLNHSGEMVERHLQKLKLFEGLSQSELQEVGQFVKPLRFRGGENICFAGQKAQFVYMIESGEVRQITGGLKGQPVVTDLYSAGETFGERAVVQGVSYSTTLQAVGEVECWTLAKADFDIVTARYPALAMNVARLIAEDADRTARRQKRPLPPPVAPFRRAQAPAFTSATRPQPPAMQAGPRPMQTASVTAGLPPVGVRTVPGKPWERVSGNLLRPMPAANSRPIQLNGSVVAAAIDSMPSAGFDAYSTPIGIRAMRSKDGFGRVSAMSTNGKIKLGIAVLFILFLMVIVPLMLILVIVGQASSNQGIFFGAPAPAPQLPLNLDGDGIKRVAVLPGTGKIAVIEKTATATRLPPTAVPTSKPTTKPTVKRPAAGPNVAQSRTLPSPTPVAAAAATLAPLPPRVWDKRLGPGGLPLLDGVGLREAIVQPGQTFWRLVKMQFQDVGAEAGNDHTIYISIVDENGQRLDDQTVIVTWDQSGAIEAQRLSVSEQKPKGDYCECNYNWPLYGGGYRVKVDGSLPSDEPYGMIMPEKRHVNYRLTFQRAVMP